MRGQSESVVTAARVRQSESGTDCLAVAASRRGLAQVLVSDRGPGGRQSEPVPPVAGSVLMSCRPCPFPSLGGRGGPGAAADSVCRP